MKRLFSIVPLCIAVLFVTAFPVISPIAYYHHLSSCPHGHGHCTVTAHHHGGNAGVVYLPDGRTGGASILTASGDRDCPSHDPAACPICHGFTQLHQGITSHSRGLSAGFYILGGALPPDVSALSRSIQFSTCPRAPPLC